MKLTPAIDSRAEVSQTNLLYEVGHIMYFYKPKVVLLNIKEGYSADLFQAGKYIK